MNLGLPSFYITINPLDICNPIVQIIDGKRFNIDDMTKGEIPTYWEQSCMVAKNPFLGANFFDMYMMVFVDTLLGRGMDDCKGVIGQYKLHYETVEAQGRGTPHCHLLLWIEGSLNLQETKERVLVAKDKEFLEKPLFYIDDSIHTHVPDNKESNVTVLLSKYHPSLIQGPTKTEK